MNVVKKSNTCVAMLAPVDASAIRLISKVSMPVGANEYH